MLLIGNESSGKSSLADRLGMMPLLPRGEGTCTRMPIMLRMRHSDTPKLPLLLVIDDQSGAVLRRVTLTLIGGEVDVREQMNAIILEEHPQLDSVRALPCAACAWLAGWAVQHVRACGYAFAWRVCNHSQPCSGTALCMAAHSQSDPPPPPSHLATPLSPAA